jgi:hypothetical protein
VTLDALNDRGIALDTLGKRVAGPRKARPGSRRLLGKRWGNEPRDRVPDDWAFARGSLASAEILSSDRTKDPAGLAAARQHVLAARQVFMEAKATQYLAMSEQQLAAIGAREA